MEASLIGFAVLLALCFAGVPLGFALLLVGLAGFAFERGLGAALAMSGQQILDFSTNYGLTVLPLFVLMGSFIHRAELSDELYEATNAWLGHHRGGLAMATVGACAGFAAVSGSSLATAATMSKVAMPPMRRFGYADSLAAGSIAAGGTLGILIPPSVPMVIYGILTETDIGKLFIAGILPGLLMVLLFFAAIAAATRIRPRLGPPGERLSPRARWRATARVWGVLALFVLVIGGIYLGVFTPTEAAGIGAFGAFLFAAMRRKLGFAACVEALVDAGRTTAIIFTVGFGALVFSNFVTLAGLTAAMVELIRSLEVSPTGVVLAMCVLYVILGCVFDSLAMLLLTVPIFFPIVAPLGVDPVWFGIIVIVVVEIGLITPPIGMNVFMVRSVLQDVDTWTIFNGVWPFLAATLAALALLFAFPGIATWLPEQMVKF
ncbi:MAG TPA: TRAP transporter large permease [Burkholderiales bacterium]|nr:TRAP transporter large permease [Burkholderiales bacterium]